MNLETVFTLIKEFNKESHGSTNYDEEELYIMAEDSLEFVPLRFLKKKMEDIDEMFLHRIGFVYGPYDILDKCHFNEWYEKQFAKKLSFKAQNKILIMHRPNRDSILSALQVVHQNYDVLRDENILLNSKNLPTQLGEWYAKSIFGLKQVKSSSQRGFDFELDGQRAEVKVHWSDKSSPKGVKIKKSMIELSDCLVLIYEAANFLIRDLCILDSDYVLRKFAGKGHTIFLKDSDISNYFFSRSSKQYEKVKNKDMLFTFSSPSLIAKLEGKF